MSHFLCSIFKNRLYLIIIARVYTRENLHNSKKNINFARFLSGKQVNVFSKILIIGHFVKCVLQRMVFGRNKHIKHCFICPKGLKNEGRQQLKTIDQ